MIVLVAVAALFTDSLALCFLALFALGAQATFSSPVRYALLPQHLMQDELVDGNALLSLLPMLPADDLYFELAFAKIVMGWLEKEEEHKSLLEIAARYFRLLGVETWVARWTRSNPDLARRQGLGR